MFESTMMKTNNLFKSWTTGGARMLAGMGLVCVAGAAMAQGHVTATVGGEIAPGVYGRVDIGNGPPPALWYPQPMVISPQPVYVQRSPIYLYVPPGHAKNWAKHCSRYAACGQPVYFVKEPPRGASHYRDDRRDRRHDDRRERWRDDDRRGDHHDRGRGRGNDHRKDR